MKRTKFNSRWVVMIAAAVLLASVYSVQAAEDKDDKDDKTEEVIVLGSRNSKPRSAADSPVPVDVISGDDFNMMTAGSADISDNLRALVPSYTATPATGDGSAFVRPTSLRGLAPDQTLVLVNGKRRHRSALVQFFAPAAGNGAHGPDIGMIPSIAIKRVEVLRDGAAAQYGSDAIAGVINFEMKDNAEGTTVEMQYGQYFQNETSEKVGVNSGFALGDKGFVSVSLEGIKNEALSRGNQRPDAQGYIDSGVVGVGADSPFGDAPFAQTWGRPQTEGERLFWNSGYDLSENKHVYVHGNYANTRGRYRFFYRNQGHSTLASLADDGYTGSLLQTGYTPFLDGNQKDVSVVGGLKGDFDDGTSYDFSVSYGRNQLDYFLNNTINPSLGLTDANLIPQRDFDVGGYEQKEVNLNADFGKTLNDQFFLAYGGEWRQESYTAVAGETNSYVGAGSNGLKGIAPKDAGVFQRDNVAFYADVEQDINDKTLVQYAVRYEDFSDFGGTLNGKIAGRYRATPSFALRAAASTGFHAPTPGQANVQTTITTFDGSTGLQIEEGLLPSTDPLVAAAGGQPLKEETAVNYSVGFTADVGSKATFTVDAYNIDVKDRIYRTGDIPHPDGDPTHSISFYTNALEVRSQGIDVVATAASDWSATASTDWTLAFGYNKIDVLGQTAVQTATGPVNPVSASIIEDIENNYPNIRSVLTANTSMGAKTHFLTRANYYGTHYDERGTIGASTNPSAEIAATLYVDLELGYQMTENVMVAVGAINVFDQFVGEIHAPNANRDSVGLQYPRRSAANYEGGSFYVRSKINF